MSQLYVDNIKGRTGGAINAPSGIVVSGVGTFSGNVSIAGTLTYEDVTNIDSVGIITAQSGLNASGGNIVVGAGNIDVGAGNIDVTGNVNISGVTTSGTYEGDASEIVSGKWTLGADSTNHYTFTGIGFTVTTNDPEITLQRGMVYQFVNNMGAHPFRIQSTMNGSAGTEYNNGVTNNNVSNGTLTFKVPFDAPSKLYYQCTAHNAMGGTINIDGGPVISSSTGADFDGYKVENGYTTVSGASGTLDFVLLNGHIQTHQGASSGNYGVNFRTSPSVTVNSIMDVGDVITCTLMVASSSHYLNGTVQIDGSSSNLDIDYVGGSAPSSANGSGYDIYTFTIQKTATTPAYHIVVNAMGAN